MKLKNTTVEFPNVAFSQTLPDGETPNPFWADLEIVRGLGIKAPTKKGDCLILTGITDYTRFTISKMLGIVQAAPALFGGKAVEVYNYPCWAKLPVGYGEIEIPEFIGATPVVIPVEDPDLENPVDPESRTRKWGEFRPGISKLIDGFYYVPMCHGGDYFKGSILTQLKGLYGKDVEFMLPNEVPQPEPEDV